ncbi:clusterin associated protein 1 [Trypanosoma grayi]|uniref:clusterin associated protein 1 n=1 Tax=Trypanosoma grayi TaxID=71804 RepID=UPI0004F490E9|nr:clusterin associated protein 1 [Trypanosoma grayi]KEG12064.1 clusterin associated protein 1 [Trypanosoma grayi]
MSFRELRSFAETMRLLGYPGLISMESFRNPNVELVADSLFWLIKRYEPSAEIVYEIEREADRVFFFKQICEVALAKGRIKLNIKKLYQSDGNAVQEMLILANVLKKAMNATGAEEPDHAGLQQMVAQKNVQDAKRVQQLCSDLTGDGSNLFFLIEEEISQRSERQRVLSRATEVGEFERRLRDVLSSVGKQVEQLQSTIANLAADETTLEQKIESKKTQLERAQKRLKSLMAVRPAFMEEYEKHEGDLQSQFVVYLEQYRNLEYLEHELAKFNAAEDALLEEHETRLRVMRERLRKEELNALRGEASRKRGSRGREAATDMALRVMSRERDHHLEDDDDDDDDDGEDDDDGRGAPAQARGRSAHLRVRNAMEEGSSVSETSEEDVGENRRRSGNNNSRGEEPPRPQGALGRARPSPSASADARARRAQAEGRGSSNNFGNGMNGGHESSDNEEGLTSHMSGMRKARAAAPNTSSGYAPMSAGRGSGVVVDDDDDDEEEESETDVDSDSTSDIDTSDISTDDEEDDDDDDSSI